MFDVEHVRLCVFCGKDTAPLCTASRSCLFRGVLDPCRNDEGEHGKVLRQKEELLDHLRAGVNRARAAVRGFRDRCEKVPDDLAAALVEHYRVLGKVLYEDGRCLACGNYIEGVDLSDDERKACCDECMTTPFELL